MSHDAPVSGPSFTQKQHKTEQEPVRLNLGCGRNILEGWWNVDRVKLPGVDIVAELDRVSFVNFFGDIEYHLPFEDNSVDEFLLSHVLEHITHTLPLMQELYRIAKPNALCTIRVPHGASDDAWEDPTHVRPYFPSSFGYFSQPYYWRADYGYRGDWKTNCIELHGALGEIVKERNAIGEMVAHLTAVKPIRESLRELQVAPRIVFL